MVKTNRLKRLRSQLVFVLGSGRSGTTWLAELINYDKTFRFVFEPFHPDHTLPDTPFDETPMFADEGKHAEYKAGFDRIISGEHANEWINRYNETRYTRRVLMKCIRVNLLAGWIQHTYPRAIVLFMVRNPYAVIESRLRTNWGWEEDLGRIQKLDLTKLPLTSDQLALLKKKTYSTVEKLFLIWCLENVVSLKMVSPNATTKILMYEDLVSQPDKTLQDLRQIIGRRFNVSQAQASFSAPSKTSVAVRKSYKDHSEKAKKWHKSLAIEEQRKLDKIARAFNVNELYPDIVTAQ